MPLTNEVDGDAPEDGRHHIWLNAEPSTIGESTGSVTDAPDKVPALCGEVHVNHVGELVRISELPGHTEDLKEFGKNISVCSECGDRAREALGLEPRWIGEVRGVGGSKATALRRKGYHTSADLRRASQQELSAVPEIGNALAARIKADVGDESGVDL
jgi:hypothetical protein